MDADKVLREAVALCREHGAGRVVLFGSRAKGTALPESDIDIAVSGVQDVTLVQYNGEYHG